MTITDTYRWNGKHGLDWVADVPNPPGPDLTNWDNISDPGANPSFPTGGGDLAVIDLGGAIDVTTSQVGGAEEIQIVQGSTVTFSSGHFGAGAEGEQGGMLIDEDAELIIAGSGTMANQGSLDIVGLTGNGTLTLQPNAGFDDLGMIVGADADAHGVVMVDAAFGFIVAQSGPTDGVLIVGEDGDGTVDVSDTSAFGSATAILGKNDGSTGEVDLNNAIWAGNNLTIGPAGNGVANVRSGSEVVFTNTFVGPNGLLNVTGAAATPGVVLAPILTLAFGTIDVTGGGEVNVGSAAGSIGAVSVAGTKLTALGTIKGNVVVGDHGVVQATGSAPGSLMIDGNVHGTGTIEPLMTLEVSRGIDSGVDIDFSPSIGAQVGDLVLDVPAANLGTIVGFGVGNTIDVEGSLYTDTLFIQGTSGAAGTLTLSGIGFSPLSFAVAGDYSPDSFIANSGTTDTVVTLCFVAGTRIATPHGEIAVEQLGIGDEVLTAGGLARPIVWVGIGKVLAMRGRRNAATPVIVRKGALAGNVPCRDLRITKGHSLFIDGVLIPVEELINHRSILWDDQAQEVAIFHVELATHDVLIADGAPTESYRDNGNRWLFRNANAGWSRPPQAPCAPVLSNGAVVDAIWQRLLERAGQRPGIPLTDDPDLHLQVDGKRVDAVSRSELVHIFRLMHQPKSMRIGSRSAVPQELGLTRDPRLLGVALRQIQVTHAARICMADADDARLTDGFHEYESNNGFRWTDGDAAIPPELFASFSGSLEVVLQLGATMCYVDEGVTLQAA
jgi:Hint domain